MDFTDIVVNERQQTWRRNVVSFLLQSQFLDLPLVVCGARQLLAVGTMLCFPGCLPASQGPLDASALENGWYQGEGTIGQFWGAGNFFFLSWSWLILCFHFVRSSSDHLNSVPFCMYTFCLGKHEQGYKNREKKSQQMAGERTWEGGSICSRVLHLPAE